MTQSDPAEDAARQAREGVSTTGLLESPESAEERSDGPVRRSNRLGRRSMAHLFAGPRTQTKRKTPPRKPSEAFSVVTR
jgi:hypothetical protein